MSSLKRFAGFMIIAGAVYAFFGIFAPVMWDSVMVEHGEFLSNSEISLFNKVRKMIFPVFISGATLFACGFAALYGFAWLMGVDTEKDVSEHEE